MRVPFQVKFLLFSVAILAFVLGFAFYYLYNQALDAVGKKFTVDFAEGRDAALSLMKLRLDNLSDKVHVISKAPQIRPILETSDVDYATIQFSFSDFRESLGADYLIVVSGKGLVQYWADRPEATGRSMKGWTIVADALNAKRSWGVQVIDSSLVMLAAVPVYTAEQGSVNAVLLAGQRIGDEIADDIRRISSMDVVFSHSTQIQSGTLISRDRTLLQSSIEKSPVREGYNEDVELRGEIFRCAFAALPGEDGVGMLFLTSKDRVLHENLAPIKKSIGVAAVVGIIFSFFVSYFVARQQTKPIRALVAGTKAVESGDFKHRIRVVQLARDEMSDLADSFNEMIVDLDEKQKMESVLHMGLGKEIAEAMLKSGALGGEERKVTMLFSDLRGFTSLSEKLTPTQVIGMLNDYMTRMSRCIEEEGGVVDKYVGDEIMALFGAPVAHPDDAERAVRSAIKKREALKKFNEERSIRGEFAIKMGVGINTGRVVAGNMGSENRRNYTVIGSACNLASRLCANAAAEQILISESTYQEIKDIFPTRKLDPIRVKNVSEPVQIYEVL